MVVAVYPLKSLDHTWKVDFFSCPRLLDTAIDPSCYPERVIVLV